MKKNLILISALCIAGLTLAGCNNSSDNTTETTDTSLKVYDEDAWSMEYDPDDFTVSKDEQYGDVTFSFYNEEIETAGSNYVAILVEEDTDYKTVLENEMKDNDDKNAEIIENDFGKDSIDSYEYLPETEKSEDSDLNISTSYTAIPYGKDVILIETFRTIGTDEEVEQGIDDTFASMMDTFSVK